ncbi:MAG: dihydropteroate synthase [Actinobacteria bacterium]|nr:dihydropteroate synthase [Acidimicrobiia bacterium]MCA1736248.1 dihydropteroate synthase [Actinomycetota bacterium]MDQ3501732.1 dihydropteroate synthase [Actinomycetota bacterium]
MATSWLTARGRLDLSTPRLMGIVNVSPDSFSDGGRLLDAGQAIAHARTLQAEGADIVDIGGESTRPNADEVSVTTELERVVPVVEGLAGEMVSVDTSKGEVAAAALAAGAAIVNDVRAGEDPRLLESVAAYNAGLVLMHMQGNPRTMQENPHYQSVVDEVSEFLSDRARKAMQAGVSREQICVDPGIGFGKNVDHNLELLAGLEELRRLGYPLVIGTSRKAFLGRLTGLDVAADRDVATAVSVVLAWERGGSIFRVHNVAVCKAALAVGVAIVRPSEG